MLVAFLAPAPFPITNLPDLPVYRAYADLLDAGVAPYSGFELEYPPLALLPIWLGGLVGTDPQAYAILLGTWMLLAFAAVLVITARLAAPGGAGAAAGIVALTPVLAGHLVHVHFDPVPIALTMGALLLVSRGRGTLGLGVLALGVMTKPVAAVLAPVLLAWLLGRGARREAAFGAAAFAAVVIVVSLPFLGDSAAGYREAYTFHAARPVQIESTPASVAFIAGGVDVTGNPVRPDRFKSNGVESVAAGPIAAVCAVLALAAVLAAALAALRRPDGETLFLAAFAALLAFVALGKVLSAQFALWLVPFAALAWTYGRRRVATATLAAVALTQLDYPWLYDELVREEALAVAVVALRNALLLGALVGLLARLVRPARAPARSRPPAVAARSG